jgi:excisionase family DNA binding protein
VTPFLVSHSEAAELAGVSLATWMRMVSAGRTPAPIKLSRGLVRFRTADLQLWVAQGCPERNRFEVLQREST